MLDAGQDTGRWTLDATKDAEWALNKTHADCILHRTLNLAGQERYAAQDNRQEAGEDTG